LKLHLLDRRNADNRSFSVKHHSYPYFLKIWHYHPELELVLIKKSTGTRFIGDSVEKFEPGEVVLIGSNLPHMWVNDDAYFAANATLVAEAVGIHFKEDFLGTEFFEIPEMRHISQLFIRAKQGITFLKVKTSTLDKIMHLDLVDDFEKTLKLIEILHDLAAVSSYRLLSSIGFINSFNKTENKSLDRIYEFVFKNFTSPIGSKDAAEVANMNSSAFSRYFKRIHRKTFTRYLNELRVGYACKLILENKTNITAICYDCGFNNISNFNRQFKIITTCSPTEYMEKHANV
jgi:AraC-like DNA-binding protein